MATSDGNVTPMTEEENGENNGLRELLANVRNAIMKDSTQVDNKVSGDMLTGQKIVDDSNDTEDALPTSLPAPRPPPQSIPVEDGDVENNIGLMILEDMNDSSAEKLITPEHYSPNGARRLDTCTSMMMINHDNNVVMMPPSPPLTPPQVFKDELMIEEHDSNILAERLIGKRYPRGATNFVNDNRQLPIHVACEKGQDSEVIKALIQLHPLGLTVKDNYGKLPLHYACAFERRQTDEDDNFMDDFMKSRCSKVTMALIQPYPEGAKVKDNDGQLPLHYACVNKWQSDEVIKGLIYAYPEGLTVEVEGFRGGNIALHTAMNREGFNVIYDAFKKTISVNNEAQDTDGFWSLHNACKGCVHSLDAIKDIMEEYPLAVRRPDEEGCWPLHYACMSGQDYDVIHLLIEKFPAASEIPDKGGSRPLHHACKHKDGYSLKVIKTLLDVYEDGAQTKDKFSRLPLHYACKRGQSLEVIKALLDIYPTGAKCRDVNEFFPLHYAVMKASEREDFLVIKALIRAYPNALYKKNKDGCSPFELDEPRGGQFTKFITYLSGEEDSRESECTDTAKAEYERILIYCKDFMPLGVLRIGFLDKKTLVSKSFIKWLNGQICNRNVVFMLVFEFYLHIAWISTFLIACRNHFKEDTSESWQPIALVVFSSVFLIFELGQMCRLFTTGAVMHYFLDWWEWLDISTSVMVIISAVNLRKDSNVNGRLLMATGCLQSLFLLSYLKKTFFPFSKFVSGVIKIIWALMPFLIVSTLTLYTFSFMYFVKGQAYVGDVVDFQNKAENSFADLNLSFQTVFGTFAGGAEETKIPLDYIFGIVIIIVLLNVVIAVVSDEWAKAIEAADESFWSYRLDLLIDQTRWARGASMWMGHHEEFDFGSGHLDKLFINEDTAGTTMKEFKTKLVEISMEKNGVLKCIWILIQCFVFVLLGFLSCGILWPRFFREMLLFNPPATSTESLGVDELLLAEYMGAVDKLSEKLNGLEDSKGKVNELLDQVSVLLKKMQ